MTILEQLIIDLGTAPTGGIGENFEIVHMSEQMSDYFIKTVAKHLIELGWSKETDVSENK